MRHLPIDDARSLLARRRAQLAAARSVARRLPETEVDVDYLLEAVCAAGASYYGLIESLVEGGWPEDAAVAEAQLAELEVPA
jgi:hypothetical protein